MGREADAPPCTVVVVPTHGSGNRMCMLSCAHAYAAHHGCALQALWRTTLHMPTPWADLFATPLAQPDPNTVVRHGDRLYTVASIAASFARLSADDPDACEPGPPAMVNRSYGTTPCGSSCYPELVFCTHAACILP